MLDGIFSWMDISDNPKQAMEKLKSFELYKTSTTLRDRKKQAQAATARQNKPTDHEPAERSLGAESESQGSLESDYSDEN